MIGNFLSRTNLKRLEWESYLIACTLLFLFGFAFVIFSFGFIGFFRANVDVTLPQIMKDKVWRQWSQPSLHDGQNEWSSRYKMQKWHSNLEIMSQYQRIMYNVKTDCMTHTREVMTKLSSQRNSSSNVLRLGRLSSELMIVTAKCDDHAEERDKPAIKLRRRWPRWS